MFHHTKKAESRHDAETEKRCREDLARFSKECNLNSSAVWTGRANLPPTRFKTKGVHRNNLRRFKDDINHAMKKLHDYKIKSTYIERERKRYNEHRFDLDDPSRNEKYLDKYYRQQRF